MGTSQEEMTYPPELLAAALLYGQRDASRIGVFLTTVIEEMKEDESLGDAVVDLSSLPAAWLLDLAAALRLVEWESHGLLRLHLGLPSAQEALTGVLQRWGVPDPQLTLCRVVLNAYFRHFAWTGLLDLGADLVLEPIDEERLAIQVAEFLWQQRDALEQSHEQNSPN